MTGLRVAAVTGGLVLSATVGISLGQHGALMASQFAVWTPLALLAGLAFLILRSEAGKGDALSPLSLIAVFCLVQFVLGGAYFILSPPAAFAGRFTDRDIGFAAAVAGAGLAVVSLSYRAGLWETLGRRLPVPRLRRSDAGLVGAIVLCLLLGWWARAIELESGRYFHDTVAPEASTGSTWLISVFSGLPTLGALLIGVSRKRLFGTPAGLTFCVLIALEFAWYVPTGERAAVVGLGISLLVYRYYRTHRVPWKLLAIATLIAAFVVFPTLAAFRDAGQEGQQNVTGTLSRVGEASVDGGISGILYRGSEATLSRMAVPSSFAAMIHQGPAKIRSEARTSLYGSVGTLVPRALSPNKADPTLFANRFGRTYHLLYETNRKTRVAAGQISQLYAAGGILVVVVGMFVVGALLRVMAGWLAGRLIGETIAVSLYAVLAAQVARSQETAVSVGLLGVIKTAVILTVVLAVGVWAGRLVGQRTAVNRSSRQVEGGVSHPSP